MTRLLHVSDLHFGRVDPEVRDAFLEQVPEFGIDMSVVSGDLTQRAKVSEFREAADFVARLPSPRVLVPGNHDIPLYNVYGRFVSKLARYKRLVTEDLLPVIETEEVIVAGISTARSLTIKDGKVRASQIRHLRAVFGAPGSRKIKVLVTHHPLHLLEDDERRVASRSRLAVDVVRECGVDVLLSGHYHRGASGVSTVHRESRYDAILVQAGTSLSTRHRGQANAFNVLDLGRERICVRQYEWEPGPKRFFERESTEFRRDEGRWSLKHKRRRADLS